MKLIDYDLIDETMKKHLKKPPYELKLFIYSIGTSKEKSFLTGWIKTSKRLK